MHTVHKKLDKQKKERRHPGDIEEANKEEQRCPVEGFK